MFSCSYIPPPHLLLQRSRVGAASAHFSPCVRLKPASLHYRFIYCTFMALTLCASGKTCRKRQALCANGATTCC